MESRPSRRNMQPETYQTRQLLIPAGVTAAVLTLAAGGTFLWQHDSEARERAAIIAATLTPAAQQTAQVLSAEATGTAEALGEQGLQVDPTATPNRRLTLSESIA